MIISAVSRCNNFDKSCTFIPIRYSNTCGSGCSLRSVTGVTGPFLAAIRRDFFEPRGLSLRRGVCCPVPLVLRLRELFRAELLPDAKAPPNLPAPAAGTVVVVAALAAGFLASVGFAAAFAGAAGFLGALAAAAACLRFSFSLTYCFKLLSVCFE